MKTLSFHIERLLLQHDCVVVPHFGAFVVCENTAVRSESENLFFPPSRLVRFNPEILQDDHLLHESVCEERQCSSADAKRAIQGMVLDLRQQLLADGQVDFGTIGVFTQDEDGELSFSSCQSGVTTPRYYGLDAFVMARLAVQPIARGVYHRSQRRFTHPSTDNITIRIPKRGLRNVAAAAAIAILSVLLISPFDITDIRSHQASIIPSEETGSTASVDIVGQTETTIVMENTEMSAKEAGMAKDVAAKHEGVSEAQKIEASATSAYCVVLASNVSRRNAENFVAQLHEMGFTKARVYDNGKMLRVIIDGMDTENEAANMAHELHGHGGDLQQAWVMKL
ncbi:MAG: SPOR domain-containing protein [Bacteroidales bacterium]|nr:SPOR domain-containing protein [Bacteroidales bacterium]